MSLLTLGLLYFGILTMCLGIVMGLWCWLDNRGL